jgi:AcrR family transcriptional regulator
MGKRQRIALERQARMDRILDSAETLFTERGYTDTSINDIAEHADFSRTSIYQYFKGKEEIYLRILEHYTDRLTESSREATAAVETVPDKVRAFLKVMLQFMKDKPAFFALYFIQRHQVEPRLPAELKAHLNTKRKKLENVFRDFYRQGIENGEVRNIRVKDASNLFFAQIMGMMLFHEYYEDEFDVTIDERLDLSLKLYLEFIEKVE